MGNLIHFPSTHCRNWAETERGARESLRQAGADAAMSDFVCRRLKVAFDEAYGEFTAQIPSHSIEFVKQVSAFHHERANRYLLSLLLAYIELYKAGIRE
ncbi:hypothetical protein [Chromobacterium haemolyticum]|uniref:hypothetical protein n=1 Tax=Chromobacterium haemolyticum TaxID=394935 RepID=UPI00307FAF5E